MTTVIDDYEPMYQGDTKRWGPIQVTYKDGTHPNFTGLATKDFYMRLQDVDEETTVLRLNGAVSVTDGVNGTFVFDPTASDMATSGIYLLWITVTYVDGKEETFKPKRLTILEQAMPPQVTHILYASGRVRLTT